MDKFNEQVMDLCRRDRIVDARSLCVSALSEELTDAARAKIYKKLAYVESRSGNHDISIEYLLRARSLDPSHRGIIHALMCAYVRNNEFERVVEIADELIALDARFSLQSFTSDAYFHKAYACWRLGRFEEAKVALLKCDHEEPVWISGGLLSKSALMNRIVSELSPDDS